MKKKIIIIAIVVLGLIGLIIGINSKKSVSKIPSNVWYNMGDVTYYLYQGNEVSFNHNKLVSKHVQNAINELYAAMSSDCYIGYTKGEETATLYTCSKSNQDSFSALLYEASNVLYDNTDSQMESSNVQEAIVELTNHIPYCKNEYTKQNEIGDSYDCVRTIRTPLLAVASSSVTLTYGTNGSNTYAYDGDGILSCQSSDTTKVTCSVNTANNTISLTPVVATTDNVTITVSATAGTLYAQATPITFTTTVNKRTVTVTAPGVSSSTFTYNNDNKTLFTSAGSCSAGGTMYWYSAPTTNTTAPSFSTSTWTTTAPARTAKNAGTYRYYYYCRVTDTANNEGTNINTVKYVSKAIGKATPTFSLSATSASVTCLTSKQITVTTNGDGAITCTTGNSKATCSVSGKKVTISGVESGSVTVSIKLNAGTNYTDAPVGKVSTTVTCYVWKATYSSFQQCQNNCKTYTQCRDNGLKCTNSKDSQPTSSSSNGGQCWCKQ